MLDATQGLQTKLIEWLREFKHLLVTLALLTIVIAIVFTVEFFQS